MPLTDDEIDQLQVSPAQPIVSPRNRALSDDLIDSLVPAPPDPAPDASAIQRPPTYDMQRTTRGGQPSSGPDLPMGAVLGQVAEGLQEVMPAPSDVGKAFGYAGKVLKGAGYDAYRTGRSLGAGVGLPPDARNIESAVFSPPEEPLPSETQEKLPMPVRIGGGILHAMPKIAAITASGGLAATAGAGTAGTLFTEMITAGGLFGLDDAGNFHPKEAVIGALIPGVGAASRFAVAKAIGTVLKNGSKGAEGLVQAGEAAADPATRLTSQTAQKLLEAAGEQAGINTFTIAMEMPELAQLYHTNPEEFKTHLAELIGSNLAFALMGTRKLLSKEIPSETQAWIMRNADELAKKQIIASIAPDALAEIYSRGNAPDATPQEQQIWQMINSTLQPGGEPFKKGVLVVSQEWPALLAKALGIQGRSVQSIASAVPITRTRRPALGFPTKGENAPTEQGPVEEVSSAEAGRVQEAGQGSAGTVQPPAQTSQEPGPAGEVQAEAKPPVKPDMATAKAVLLMTPAEFRNTFPTGGFNHVNLPLGQNVTDEELSTLKTYAQQETRFLAAASEKASKTKADADLQDMLDESHKLQFFNEAIAEAEKKRATGQPTKSEGHTEPNPSPEQIEAGNAPKRKVTVHGLDISIENEKGGIRKSKPDAKVPWEVTMPAAYGYIKGTVGKDKDHIDAYLGDNLASGVVVVIDQMDPDTKQFDEHKVMLGFNKMSDAVKAYEQAFADGRGSDRVLDVNAVGMPEFKQWLKDGNHKKPFGTKPATETKVAPTVPELPETVAAQLQMLQEGKRDVVMITEGEKAGIGGFAPTLPAPIKSYSMLVTPIGRFIYNPQRTNRGEIQELIDQDRIGDILGYGIPRKPKPGTEIGAVVVRDANGLEKQGVLTDKEHLAAVQAAAKKVMSPGDVMTLEPESEVIARRQPKPITDADIDKIEPAPRKAGDLEGLTDTELDALLDEASKPKEKPARILPKPGTVEDEYHFGKMPTGISKAQWREMAGYNDYEQVAKWGYSHAMVIEWVTTGHMPAPPSPQKPKRVPAGKRPPPKPKAEKTAKDIAADAAKAGVKGIEESIEGLHKLFGGGKHVGAGPSFDEKTYQEAKPHFEKAYEEFTKAGRSLGEFLRFILDKFDAGVREYIKRFVLEMKAKAGKVETRPDANKPTEGTGGSGRAGGTEPATPGTTGGGEETPATAPGASPEVQPPGSATNEGSPAGSGTGSGGSSVPSADRVPAEQQPAATQPGAGEESPGSGPPVLGEPAAPNSPPELKNLRLTESPAPTGGVARVKANIEAIELVKFLEKENRLPTEEERKTLAAWSGWGSFKELFNEGKAERREYDPGWVKRYGKAFDKLKTLLNQKEFNAAAESSVNAHYTSPEAIRAMWDMAKHLGFSGGKVLESAVGRGDFIGFAPDDLHRKMRWTAIEMEPITAKIAGYLYPEADVRAQPFENAKLPRGHYDLNITNVPFHEVGPGKEYPDLNLHNFFIARGIDMVKPGGLLILITTKGTMDLRQEQRKFLVGKADLIAAIRLPNNAFKESADTEVVTDILILRKPDGKPFELGQAWTNTESITVAGEQVAINQYFVAHPEMILGKNALTGTMYRKDEYTVEGTGPIGPKLESVIKLLPKDILKTDKPEIEVSTSRGMTEKEDFTLALNEKGLVTEALNYTMGPVTSWDAKNPTLVKRAREYIKLRDALLAQYSLERDVNATDDALGVNRQKLKAMYDAWVRANGTLNQNDRKTSFLSTDPAYYTVMGLENVSEEIDPADEAKTVTVITPADVLSKRTLMPDIPPEKSDSAADAMGVSMSYKGILDIDYVKQLTGLSEDQIESELIAANLAFKDPESGRLMPSGEYLTGEVRDKLAKAMFAAKDNELFARNVEALKAVIPPNVPFERISLDIAARWTPVTVLNKFATQILGLPENIISFTPVIEEFAVKEVARMSAVAETQWSTKAMAAPELLRHAMNFKRAVIMEWDAGLEKYVRDDNGTALANQMIGQIKARYAEWMRKTDDTVPYKFFDPRVGEYRTEALPIWDVLEREYNRKANSFVVPDYDGTNLRLPGLNMAVRRTQHLLNGVQRAINAGYCVFGHGVGSGKTFLGVVLGRELQRIGLAKKFVHVIKKPTVAQYRVSIQRAYPGSRVLIPSKKDFDPENRKRLLSRIASTRWDAIVLTHEQFKSISPGEEMVSEFFEEQLNQLRQILRDQGAYNADMENEKFSTRGLDPAVRNIVRKLKGLKKRMTAHIESIKKRQDKGIAWENLGIDGLFIDESHNFKKMPLATNMEGEVKGIPSDFSQRAVDLLIKVRDIQSKTQGRNIFFASGTPVSNTLAELWIQFNATAPKLMKDLSIETFDSFASAFSDVVTNFEMGWDGSFRDVTRMARFKNPSGLTTMTRLGMDVKIGNKELGLDVPDVEGGKPTLRVIKPTKAFERWALLLDRIAENWDMLDAKGRWLFSWVPIATMRAGVAAALDPRCVFPSGEDDPNSKVNTAVADIVEEWERGRANRTTMMVFADLYRTMNTAKLMDFIGGEEKTSIETTEVEDKSDDSGDTGAKDSADYEKTAVGTFNLYDDIRAKLIAKGVPAHEIAVITEHDTDTRRDALFNKVRNGIVRILIGSTEKIGEGVDVPQRMSAQFHLDPPMAMTPAKLEQRIGRIIRQGNMHSVKQLNLPVRIKMYAQERSMDAAIYQMLETKATMVLQALKGQFLGDTFEDPASELTTTMAALKSAATGDGRAIKLAMLQKDVRELSVEEGAYLRRVSELRRSIEEEIRSARYARENAANHTRLANAVTAATADKETMTLTHLRSNTVVTGEKAINEWLEKASKTLSENVKEPGTEATVSIMLKPDVRVQMNVVHRAMKTSVEGKDVLTSMGEQSFLTIYIGGPEPRYSDAKYESSGQVKNLLAVLAGIPKREMESAANQEKEAANHDALTEASRKQLQGTKFDKLAELEAKTKEMRDLQSELRDEREAKRATAKAAAEAKKAGKPATAEKPKGDNEIDLSIERGLAEKTGPELRAEGLAELKELLNNPKAGLSGDAVRVALDLLDQPVMKDLDWSKLRVELKDRIAGRVGGGSRIPGAAQVSRWLIELSRDAHGSTLPHEIFHFLYHMLPDAEADRLEQLRQEALMAEMAKWGDSMPAEARTAIEEMIKGMTSDQFGKLLASMDDNQMAAEWLVTVYHLINASEYLAGIAGEKFSDESFSKRNQSWLGKMLDRVMRWLHGLLDAFNRLRGASPDIAQIIRELLAGKYVNTAEGGAKAEAKVERTGRQLSIESDEAAIPTRVFGQEDFVRQREQITPSSTQASIDYAKTIFDAAKVPVRLDDQNLWRIEPSGFDMNVEGRRLLQLLKKEIASKNEPGKAGDLLASLLNAIVYNFKVGAMSEFERPLREELYAVAQSDRSQRGLQLGALAMHRPDLAFAAENLDVALARIWSDAYGGDEVRSVISRVLEHFRSWFTDAEIEAALASKPELAELVGRLIALNRRDEGGRVYRKVQALLKPKMRKTLERLEGDARIEEAVQHILENAKRMGIEPKPQPNKKLSPLQTLLLMVTPETADKINEATAAAVLQAERNAGIKATLKATGNEADREELQARFDAGEEPEPAMVEEGLKSPEYAHWAVIRENLLDYSPTTLKLAQDLVRADFKGTRFNQPIKKVADTRIDLEKLAKSPDAEISRGLEAYLDNIAANMDMAGATEEGRQRVLALIEQQVSEQIERMREKIRGVMFKEPSAPSAKVTKEQQLAQVINAGLFRDERLDIPEMVSRVAGKSRVSRLTPTTTELVKDVLATPFYRQDELGKMFAQRMVQDFGIPPEQAAHAEAVFNQAFADQFSRARTKALEKAKEGITPQERKAIKPGTALWIKIERMVNAGGFDGSAIMQEIARAKGWSVPTDQQVRHMRDLAEREMRLRDLTPQERTVAGDDPRAIEKALADRLAATLEKRALLIKQMGTIWARFTRPISIRHLWSTRKNIAAAANEFEVANMLLKVGFAFRLPTHILTQLMVHVPTRAVAQAIINHQEELARGNPNSMLKETALVLGSAYTAALKGIIPALHSARAALAGRGEARNVDRLMSGIHLFERAEVKAKEFADRGDHGRAVALRLLALARFSLRFVQAVDNFQGIPAEYAELRLQIRNGLREQGRSEAEIVASIDRIMSGMKLKRDAALAKAREILNESGETYTDKELRETAWNMVRSRIYEDIRDLGLPADSFREMNEKLRRTIAWQERVSHGPGGLVATVGRGVSSLLQEVGLPFSFTRFANAIGSGINYALMFTPAYALANARIPGISRNEDSPWFETEEDVMQRRVQAVFGSIFGALIMALIMSGAAVVRMFWPKDKEERDLWEAQGHRPGTIEIRINDHEFIPISLTVGPGSMIAPYAAAAGAVVDMLAQREKAQQKLNLEAQKRGLEPGKVRDLDAGDWLTVGATAAWGTVMGNKALSGVAQSMTEFGIPNSKKTAAAYVSPLILGLPQWQEFSRMLGVQMDSKLASFWDYLVPLPTSGARAINMLGEPVGTPDAVQRVFQNVFAGSYPWIVDEQAAQKAPYAALFASGYRPPSIDAGKGYAINGEFRPLTDDELIAYTQARGDNMSREFGELGLAADVKSMRGAFQRANIAALESVGVDTTVKPIAAKPASAGKAGGTIGIPGRVSAYQPSRSVTRAPSASRSLQSPSVTGSHRPALRGASAARRSLRPKLGISLKTAKPAGMKRAPALRRRR